MATTVFAIVLFFFLIFLTFRQFITRATGFYDTFSQTYQAIEESVDVQNNKAQEPINAASEALKQQPNDERDRLKWKVRSKYL